MRKIRGNEISIIFQESMSSLNPVFTIGNQICEAIALHQDFSKAEVRNRALELLKSVGLPSPEKSIDDYPHQLSGGMRQRVMIAMAISCNPALLIADEPTTALDVTIQAQILDLLRKLQSENQMAMLLITHDLGVIAEMADQVAVMYAGQLVEVGAAQEIINHPKHPYTRGLLKSIPVKGMKRLEAIRGMVPDLTQLPSGCRFGDRCDWVVDACRSKIPELLPSNLGLKHQVRCIKDL
jgi:oligopeptide/dipeptide ABC transporter ATP-binding protein